MTLTEMVVISWLTTPGLGMYPCTVTDTESTVELSCPSALSNIPLTDTITRRKDSRDDCEAMLVGKRDMVAPDRQAMYDKMLMICRSAPTRPKRDVCATLRQVHDIWFHGRVIICRHEKD